MSHRSSTPDYVELPEHGLTLPRVMVETIAACLRVFRDDGVSATWHMNACGCCASVHACENGHEGYLIGSDGGYEWLEFHHDHE